MSKMSSSLRLQSTKKKYNQNDLRRLMQEQKGSSVPKVASSTKINSPLAKYNELGQLMCILCKSVVRSEDVWKIHINAKQHKQNIELAKQLKEKTHNFTKPSVPPAAVKRSAPPLVNELPAKQLKSILKNANPSPNTSQVSAIETITTNEATGLPDNFFDDSSKSTNYYEATLKKTTIKTNLISIKRNSETETGATSNGDAEPQKDETLPEGFFDDPIKDAKARHSEYKNPVEEEWEKFQQEIKEASNYSNAIIAEDQEEAITERQIDEIDEQMHNWNRVLTLEKKREDFNEKIKKIGEMRRRRIADQSKMETNSTESEDSDDDDDNNGNNETNDMDEYLDWRSKKIL